MHVVFVEPAFPRNQRQFARALKQAGAQVTGISERPLEAFDDELKSWLDGYERVSSVVNEGAMQEVVQRIQSRRKIDRLEATVEAHILPVANVRARCGIPGTSVETAYLCRDKPSMKEFLRQRDVPCARSRSASNAHEVYEFVKEVGLPIIVKPRDAAGAAGTFKVEKDEQLPQVIAASGLDCGRSVAVEEFIEGHEGFYDTLTVNGEVAHEFVTHYFPGVLEAMRTRWISPQFIVTNRVDSPGYAELKSLGRRVVKEMGIETSATHMEWFFGPKGLKFSEIGCRPPGVGAWDLYCAANEFDLFLDWAHGLVSGRVMQRPSRRYSAGIINLRPTQDGTIKSYLGVDIVREKYGSCLIDWNLPSPGTPTQPVEAGYMANAWVRMKHEDYDELRRILNFVGETVKVIAG